ncbi:MAG: hypothetical protein JST61_00515 [Acidobacteria bacterium]|nr:hypothetical protein [Acidobacteriota bacterium]
MTNSGDYSRIRMAAASSTLDPNTKLVVRQTRRGYDVYANGDQSPVRCETWPQARRRLVQLGVPYSRLDEINSRLTEGIGLVVRRNV